MNGALSLSPIDLFAATAMIVVAGVVSLLLRLDLLPRLLLASVRTVVQLLLLGQVLSWIFGRDTPYEVMALMLVMCVAAGQAAIGRSSRSFRGVFWRSTSTLIVTGITTCFAVTSVIVGVDPWYEPQYVIPLLGMILGNSLTGISISLDSLLERLDSGRDQIELDLSLGATRWEAARPAIADAVRRGMIPIINSMMVVGLVSLPGMMTGQILQGADPAEAVKWQIVVMFMLAASTALGAMGMALLVYQRLFGKRHELRAGVIES